MNIETVAFESGKPIPEKFTCQGEDVSPELVLRDVPSNAKSLALIMDDPDAPSGTFDHWIAWNIPTDTKKLKEGVALAQQGKNSFGNLGYNGPCPPSGKPHRYFFKLYALDTQLTLPSGASKKQLEKAMEGHIVGQAEMVGTYQRKNI